MKAPSFNSVEKAAEFLACAQVVGRATSNRYKEAAGEWSQRLSGVMDWAKEHPEYAGPLLGALAGGGFGAATSMAKDKEDRNTLSSTLTGALGGGLLGLGGGLAYKNRDALFGGGGQGPEPQKGLPDSVRSAVESGSLTADRAAEVMSMSGRDALRGVMDGTITPEEYALRVQGAKPPKDVKEKGWATDFLTATDPEPVLPKNMPVPEGASEEELAAIKSWGEDHWQDAYERAQGRRGVPWWLRRSGQLGLGAGAAGIGEGQALLSGQRTLGDFRAGLEHHMKNPSADSLKTYADGSPAKVEAQQMYTAADKLLAPGNEELLRRAMRHMQATAPDKFSKFYRRFADVPGMRQAPDVRTTMGVGDAIDDIIAAMGDTGGDTRVLREQLTKALRESWNRGQVHSGTAFRPWWDRLFTGNRGVQTPGYTASPGMPKPTGRWVSPDFKTRLRGAAGGGARFGAYVGLPLLADMGLQQVNKIRWRNKPVELPEPTWKPLEPLKPAGG